MEIFETIGKLLNPEFIIHWGGLALLLITIFAENGVVFGFFLPGDSLLFLSGLLTRTRPELLDTPIQGLILYLFIASVLGTTFGYWTGYHFGKKALDKEDTWWYKRKYVEISTAFYEKHGGKALILGRYLPIIRTFAPIIAGVIRVEFKSFMIFNVIGGIMWILSITLVGYYLGQFEIVKENLEWIILGFVVSTMGILANTFIQQRKKKKKQTTSES